MKSNVGLFCMLACLGTTATGLRSEAQTSVDTSSSTPVQTVAPVITALPVPAPAPVAIPSLPEPLIYQPGTSYALSDLVALSLVSSHQDPEVKYLIDMTPEKIASKFIYSGSDPVELLSASTKFSIALPALAEKWVTLDQVDEVRVAFDQNIWSLSDWSLGSEANSAGAPTTDATVLQLKTRFQDLRGKVDFTDDELKDFDLIFSILHRNTDDQIGSLKKAASFLCGTGCANAIQTSAQILTPYFAGSRDDLLEQAKTGQKSSHQAYFFSLTDVLEKFVKTPDKMKALYLLRDNLLAKVNRVRTSGEDPQDLFLDTEAAFKSGGMNDADSRDAAVELLGLYSTRGASTAPYFRLGTPVIYSFAEAMTDVAIALRELDAYSQQKGLKVYSIPTEVTTKVSYTRPYHFWMAAYLANQLSKKGFAPADILKALHINGKLYEAFADFGTNQKITDSQYGVHRRVDAGSEYQFETQKDIAFDDAGAAWGALLSAPQTLDVDQALLNMVNSSRESCMSNALASLLLKPIAAASGIDFSSYPKWLCRVKPDESLRLFEKLLGGLSP